MPDVDIDYNDLFPFIRDMNGAGEVIGQQVQRLMTISVDTFQQAVQVETPVNFGALRGSLMTYIFGEPLDLSGLVTTSLSYGVPVEFGRLPGRMPPPQALELWVVRKWGLQGEEAVQASWALARSIAAHGTKGAFMFEKGYNNALPAVMKLWEQLPGAVVEQV